jgi:hypothetical protein
MRRPIMLVLAVVVLVIGAGSSVQSAGSGCAGFNWPADAALKAFAEAPAEPLAHGSVVQAKGQAFALLLAPAADVMLPATPERPAAYAGWVRLELSSSGLFEVALSTDAWIDWVESGASLKAVAFTGAQDCPGLRKMVRFATASSTAFLLLSAKAPGSIRVVVRLAAP